MVHPSLIRSVDALVIHSSPSKTESVVQKEGRGGGPGRSVFPGGAAGSKGALALSVNSLSLSPRRLL